MILRLTRGIHTTPPGSGCPTIPLSEGGVQSTTQSHWTATLPSPTPSQSLSPRVQVSFGMVGLLTGLVCVAWRGKRPDEGVSNRKMPLASEDNKHESGVHHLFSYEHGIHYGNPRGMSISHFHDWFRECTCWLFLFAARTCRETLAARLFALC